MGKYILKAEDQEVTEEALELFSSLGYELGNRNRSGMIFTQDGKATCDRLEFWNYYKNQNGCQELTLPQLRDLVVLKRNDINDANCIYKKREAWYLASDGTYYAWQYRKLCWGTESDACVEAHDIKPIEKPQPQAPALISGADAMIAAIDGKDVEYEWIEGSGNWRSFNDEEWSAEDLKSGGYRFRLKPTTLTVNAELPKPEREFQQNTEIFSVTYEFKTREERNAFADKLRGTNS